MQAATRRQRSTTSPASQRRTRTSKPYLCVGVMEREKWSLRDGEESIRGGKIPPPLEPAPPLTPIGTPVTPNLPRAGDTGPSRPGPMAARAAHQTHSRGKTTPPPSSSQFPKLHKTIRHPGKARYPASIGPAPLRRHRCIEDPHTRAGPKRMHQPMLPAAHQPGPKPPRPSRNPNPEAERPQIPKPPPRTNPGTVRPPGWQPTSAGTGIPAAPHAAARETASKSHQYPIQAKAAAPAPNPPRNPSPGNPQMPQAHIATPRQQQKPQPDRIGTPTHTRWWSWSKEPREIDLMCQQKLFQG